MVKFQAVSSIFNQSLKCQSVTVHIFIYDSSCIAKGFSYGINIVTVHSNCIHYCCKINKILYIQNVFVVTILQQKTTSDNFFKRVLNILCKVTYIVAYFKIHIVRVC